MPTLIRGVGLHAAWSQMIDLNTVCPLVAVTATVDVAAHIYLDVQGLRRYGTRAMHEPDAPTPPLALAAVVLTTMLAFLLVFLLSMAWSVPGVLSVLSLMIPLFDPPVWCWSAGLVVLESGIALHLWSRATRRTDPTLRLEGDARALVKKGPYSVVRHPSYLSYCLCFVGLFLLLPSLGTGLLLLGVPGYYQTAVAEEVDLISRFGNEYREYMDRTGRFLPRLRRAHQRE